MCTLGTAISTVNYTYGNSTWGDLLTKYGSTTITYDAIGNPTKIGGYDLTWQGRELQSWSDDECTTVYYGYNSDGIRTYKEILDDDTGYGTRHEYVLDGGTILYASSIATATIILSLRGLSAPMRAVISVFYFSIILVQS